VSIGAEDRLGKLFADPVADMKETLYGLLIAANAFALEFAPARRLSGAAPALPPPTVVGWLEETVDIAVDASGAVRDVVLLHGTASSPTLLGPAVPTWRFRPATVEKRPVASHVLIATLVRPPQLYDNATLGAEPSDFAAAPDEVPYPIAVHRARYPPRALGDAMVLVEVLVGEDGRVREASVVQGAAGFNDEALSTAREWRFRPAHRSGELVAVYAYLAFGFRQPV
jgi:TonB family protein